MIGFRAGSTLKNRSSAIKKKGSAMSLISSLPSILKIPPLPSSSSSKKDRKPEDYLWNALMRAVYGLAVDPALYSKFCRFTPLAGPGSDNWPLMAAATWLWASPTTPIDGWSAVNWWVKFFRWQLGIKESSDVDVLLNIAPGDLGFFEMSEGRSNTYSGMICGSVLSVRYWALRQSSQKNSDPRIKTLFDLSGQWLSKWALLHSLCALPGPLISATILTPNKSSVLPLPNRPINLPILTQDGSRSTPLHVIGDPRQLILAELLDYPGRSHPWPARDPFEYWYLILCRMLEDAVDDFGLPPGFADMCTAVMKGPEGYWKGHTSEEIAQAQFKGLRWKPFSLCLFNDGSKLGFLPSTVNGNTAPIHAGYIRPSSSGSGVDSVSCWPWSKPKNQPVGSGRAHILADTDNNRELHVSSQLGDCPVVPLPSGPVTVLHFTEAGLTIERI